MNSIKCSILAFICLFFSISLFGQLDSVTFYPEKTRKHYLSIYANTFVKEVIGFTSSSLSSPYFIHYAFQPKSSMGFRYQTALGYQYSYVKDIDARVSRGDTLNLRLGIAKVCSLSRRVQLNLGVDAVFNSSSIKSNTASGFDFSSRLDSTFTKTTTTGFAYGAAFNISVMYAISKNIFVGTETYYAYSINTNKQNVTRVSKIFTPQGVELSAETETFNKKDEGRNFAYLPPLAIILTFRF